MLGNGSDNWFVGFGSGNTLLASHDTSGGTQQLTVSPSGAVTPGQSTHYAVTWAVSSGDVTVTLYVGGSSVAQAQYTSGHAPVAGSTFYLGAYDPSSGHYAGSLSAPRVWDRALSPEEVAAAARPNYVGVKK